MHAAAKGRTQLHVCIAVLSGAALLVWLVVHNSGADSTSPPYKVTAAFMALHEQVISINPAAGGETPRSCAVVICLSEVFCSSPPAVLVTRLPLGRL